MMIELENLKFATPVEGVDAFSTMRGEVDGRNAYSGVNLCDYVGDDALRVLDARLTLAMKLGVDLDDIVMPRQTHSCQVAVIDEAFRAMDIDKQEAALEGVDALVTSLKGVVIGVNTADCVPIVLTDALQWLMPVGEAPWGGSHKTWWMRWCVTELRPTAFRQRWDRASVKTVLRWVTRWLKLSVRRILTLIPSSSATPRPERLTSTCVLPTVPSS